MKRRLCLFLAVLLAVSVPLGAAAFSDLPPEGPYAAAVERLAGLGVINGFEDGSFRPQEPVTREQFAKLLYMLLNGKDSAEPPESAPFPDVAADRWSAGYIAWAKLGGSVSGRDTGLFDPAADVTYEEASKMLLQALGFSLEGLDTMAAFKQRGIEVGLFEGVSLPPALPQTDLPALRGQIAMMAANALKLEAPRFGAPIEQAVFGAKQQKAVPVLITAVGGGSAADTATALLADGSTKRLSLPHTLPALAVGGVTLFDAGWRGEAAVGRMFYCAFDAQGVVSSLLPPDHSRLEGLEASYDEAAGTKQPTEYSRISKVCKLGDPAAPALTAVFDAGTKVFLRYGTEAAGYRYAAVTTAQLPMLVEGRGRVVAFTAAKGTASAALVETVGDVRDLHARYGLVVKAVKVAEEVGKHRYQLTMAANGVTETYLTRAVADGKNFDPSKAQTDDAFLLTGEAPGYARLIFDDDGSVSGIVKIPFDKAAPPSKEGRMVQVVLIREPGARSLFCAADFTYENGKIKEGAGFEASQAAYLTAGNACYYMIDGAPHALLGKPSYANGDTVALEREVKVSAIDREGLTASSRTGAAVERHYTVIDLLLVNTDDGELVAAAFCYAETPAGA